jgi:hypothetical protein
MKAADLNKRRKLLLLLWRGLRLRKQRPSFKTESGLIVCQVQARSSMAASAALLGVFVEICEAERAGMGIECASFRRSSFARVIGRAWPRRLRVMLTITSNGETFTVAGKHEGGERSEIFEVAASYRNARRSAIRWLRGELLSGEERQGTRAAEDTGLSFRPGRAGVALRWLADKERTRVLGESGARAGQSRERGAEGLETEAEGQSSAMAGYLQD